MNTRFQVSWQARQAGSPYDRIGARAILKAMIGSHRRRRGFSSGSGIPCIASRTVRQGRVRILAIR